MTRDDTTDSSPPTLDDVQALEATQTETRDRLSWIEQRRDELVSGLARLRLRGSADSREAVSLRAELATLVAEHAELAAALPLIAKQIEEARTAALHGAAKDRLLAIKRAHASLAVEYTRDLDRLRRAAASFVDAASTLSNRHERLVDLSDEAQALAWSFDLGAPALRSVPRPADAAIDALRAVRAVDITGGKSRVGFSGVGDGPRRLTLRRALPAELPGAQLIASLPKEDAGDTDAQRRREQRREREAAAMSEFAEEAHELSKVPTGLGLPR